MGVTEGPFQWPLPDEEVRAAMDAAFQDGSWGRYHGPHGDGLCSDLSAAFQRRHALLCSSGTIGVELALRGCGVEPGDEVVLAGYDFPGNFRAAEAVGARPVLVDVEIDRWCLDVNELENLRRDRITAVIVSHLHGGLADMPRICRLAEERGWSVIEDACQQPGASIAGRSVGSWGDVSVLSFGGSKLLTAGRGGAVLCDGPQVHQRMKVFAERGNWAFPLSELQAAVLRPQLTKLRQRNLKRSESISILLDACSNVAEWLRPIAGRENCEPTYYKHAWSFVPSESDAQQRESLLAKLHTEGVPIDEGFRGFTRRSQRRCEQIGSLENSRRLSQSTVLLHHPVLLANKNAAQQIGQVLEEIVQQLVV